MSFSPPLVPERTLTQHLVDAAASDPSNHACARVLGVVAVVVQRIAALVGRPVRGDLRRQAAKILLEYASVPPVGGVVLPGESEVVARIAGGHHVLAAEPLHGAGDPDDHAPVGSVFSVFEVDADVTSVADTRELRRVGRQVCAAVALYGPRTLLLVTTGDGVDGFTLDRDLGAFILTHPDLRIPADAAILAVDPTAAPGWPAPVRRYVQECVEGSNGPRGRDFRMRWNASAVVGAVRVLTSGGLFLAPDTGRPDRWQVPLLPTAAAIALLVEQAGGAASTGTRRLLDALPGATSASTPFFFGSAKEVARLQGYFTDPDAAAAPEPAYPLFHHRSLFAHTAD